MYPFSGQVNELCLRLYMYVNESGKMVKIEAEKDISERIAMTTEQQVVSLAHFLAG